MAIFGIIRSQDKVVIGDKVRINASESFITKDEAAVTLVEIDPGDGTYVTVTGSSSRDWYLDYAYLSAATNTVNLRITTDGSPVVFSKNIVSVSEATAYLFSTDKDLMKYEQDILNWLPKGYSNWNHIHFEVQQNILDWFDEIRLFKDDGTQWAAIDVVNKNQVRRLANFMALRMIFSTLSNQVGDVYDEKSKMYGNLEAKAKNRNYISLDFNGDTEIQNSERQELRSMTIIRR